MNEWDRDNLNFIRFSRDKEWDEWMLQATNTDIDYALGLLSEYKKEIQNEITLLQDPQIVDFNDAKALIERIKK
jgi:hypothetical protein